MDCITQNLWAIRTVGDGGVVIEPLGTLIIVVVSLIIYYIATRLCFVRVSLDALISILIGAMCGLVTALFMGMIISIGWTALIVLALIAILTLIATRG